MKTQIIFDARLETKQITGIGNYIFNSLQSFSEDDYDVLVLVSNDVSKRLYDEVESRCGWKLKYCRLKPYNIFHFLIFSFWVRFFVFDGNKRNLIYSFSYSTGLPLPKLYYVTTVHDLAFWYDEHFFKSKLVSLLGRMYYGFITGISILTAWKCVCVSRATAVDVKRLFNVGSIISENIVELPEKNKSLEKATIKYLVYVGNARPHKNIKFLLKLSENIIESLKIRIVFIGSCCEDREVIEFKSTYDEFVELLYYVTDDDKMKIISQSRGLLLFSTYEGFGIPIAEALLLNTKVYCSDIRIFREFVSNGVSFYDINTEDCIFEVLHDLETDKIDEITWEGRSKHTSANKRSFYKELMRQWENVRL